MANENCKVDEFGEKGTLCHFEPRYDYTGPTDEHLDSICELNYESVESDFEAMDKCVIKKYICDVCVNCGKVARLDENK